jgi:4-amino-4-deoxy-L-arabinose transferase-like glycosyltransferase
MVLPSSLTKKTTAIFVLAVCLGLAARLAFSLGYWVDRPLTVDQTEYLMLAENFVDGNGLVYGDGESRLIRSPGYPIFLAGVFTVWRSITAVKIAQSILGALTVLLVAALAHRLSGARSAMVAALVTALYPPLIWASTYVLSETLYTLLTFAAAYVMWLNLDALKRSNIGGAATSARFLASGALVGLAVLTRPELLLFVGLISLMLLVGRNWIAAVALLAGTVIVVAPWTAHNYFTHGEVILVSSRGGPNFWLGNSELAPGDGGAGATPELKRGYDAIIREHADLSPSDLERLFYREAVTWIREHPLDWLVLLAKKFFYFWVPVGPSLSSHSRLYWIGHSASYLSLLPFAVAGFWRVVRRSPQPVVLWALAVATLLTSLIFFPLPRYRIPIFDPVMIVCAAALLRHDR